MVLRAARGPMRSSARATPWVAWSAARTACGSMSIAEILAALDAELQRMNAPLGVHVYAQGCVARAKQRLAALEGAEK